MPTTTEYVMMRRMMVVMKKPLTTNVPSIIYQPNKEEGLVFLNS
jgi:hypothetical protein